MSSRKPNKTWLVFALALTLSLGGCLGDDDSGSGDAGDDNGGDGTGNGDGDTGTGGGDNGTGGGTGMDGDEPLPPIYINGTVGGVVDCQLGAENAVTSDTQPVPAEAANRSYELTFTGDLQAPGAAGVCLAWMPGGETGNTGSVPADATDVVVMADGGQGLEYSIRIE